MGNILKLKNVGDAHTMTIKTCEATEGQFGTQVMFVGTDGNTLYLPQSSADNQLGRLELDYASVVGMPIAFSRTENKKKGSAPYWNLNVAQSGAPQSVRVESPYRAPSGGAKNQPFDEPTDAEARMAKMDKAMEERESDGDDGFAAFSAAVDAVERPKGKGAAIEDSYLALYSRVAERLVSVGKALEFPVDATGIQAATATIWITQKDKGLL